MSLGYVAVSRTLWKSPHFRDEPFTEREAWIWMITEAAWKPHKKRVLGRVVEINRGQFCHSIRFMGTAWKWHRAKVERFLNRLKTETVIETNTETGMLAVSICNYEQYQRSIYGDRDTTETGSETRPRHDRDKLEPSNKETKDIPPIVPQGDEPKPPQKLNGVKAHFADFWQRYPRKVGKAAAERSFVRQAKKVPHADIIAGLDRANNHWRSQNTDPQFIPNPATWLNQGRWDDDYESTGPPGGPGCVDQDELARLMKGAG